MRRKHYKVNTFPDEIVEEINNRLVEGRTYGEIADWLKQMGHQIGESSIRRYNKDFMAQMERLKMIKEQVKSIVRESGDTPGTEMAEAASQLSLQLIISKLQKARDLNEMDIADIIKVIPRLEQSAVRREALKFQFSKGVETAAAKIKAALRKETEADPVLQERLYEMVERIKEQLMVKGA